MALAVGSTLDEMIEAYFDESESDGKRVFVLAGWVAAAETWRDLETAWNGVLERFGVRCFHAVECAHRKRDFERWTTARQRELMTSLVDELLGRQVQGLSLRIHLDDYALLKDTFGPRWHRPYYLALWHCTVCVAELARHFGQADTTFVFAHQPEWSGRVHDHYQRMKDLNDRYGSGNYGTLRIEKPMASPGLQAADLLAYESALQEHRGRYGSNRGPRVAMARLSEKTSIRVLDAGGLLELLAEG